MSSSVESTIGSEEAILKSCEEFFQCCPPPNDLLEVKEKAADFIEGHRRNNRVITLVTSGGTTVPLEKKTVRFIDNFSSGTRGARSTEYFLSNDYAVIFLHRASSLKPFERHFSNDNLLEWFSLMEEGEKTTLKFSGTDSLEERLLHVIPMYQKVKKEATLLSIPFTTVFQYLFYLRELALLLKSMGSSVMFYLAAAVSDFYIPHSVMSNDKIQSSGQLELNFSHTPKMVLSLTRQWAPQAFTVTFKLETDEAALLPHAKAALTKYGHQVVVANLLETCRTTVTMVTKAGNSSQEDDEHDQDNLPLEWEALKLQLSKEDLSRDTEIELFIIKDLIVRHQKYMT